VLWRVAKTNESHQAQSLSFAARRPYLFVAIIEVVIIAAYLLAGTIATLLSLAGNTYSDSVVILADSVLAVVAVALVTRSFGWHRIGFRKIPSENKRVLYLFALPFLPVAVNLAPGIAQIPTVISILLYAGITVLVGFVEEIYFRGIMLQPLKTKGVWHAVIVTAFLFGATHTLNAVGGISSPLYVILQLGYATALGLTFAAVVLATNLIWPLILAHFLINFASFLNSGGTVGGTTVTAIDYGIAAAYIVIFTVYALFIVRRYFSPSEPSSVKSTKKRTKAWPAIDQPSQKDSGLLQNF
jgi:membrane protease YdiL (CAAX protease family)